jgi:Papain-like cysteine protease AvrRpt2
VLPDDWGQAVPPRAYDLPAGEQALLDRYCSEQLSPQFASILDYARDLNANRVYVESPYVDFDYRSEYANLYSRSFDPPPDKCERLLFFRDATFLGFCVARPSVKPVGRTAVGPPPSLKPHISCLAPHVARPYGQEYRVRAWPFLSQDGVYGRCAHAAIWSIARYHHLRHGVARRSITDVVEASGTRLMADQTARSSGLYLHEVAEAFAGLGLPTLPYQPDSLPSGEDVKRIICRYLNSGFPIALSTPGHLTVLIGYGEENGEFFYVRSDDNLGPYGRTAGPGHDPLGNWDMLLVPLPARIHVPGEAAELRAKKVFGEQAGAKPETESVFESFAQDELRVRTYAVEAAQYKQRLPERGLAAETVRHHQLAPASVWIWVTEFQLRNDDGPCRVVGEVAIDATSHPRNAKPVLANLPGRAVAWLPGQGVPRALDVERVDLHDTALHGGV